MATTAIQVDGPLLRRLRHKQLMSQMALAERSGVTQLTISRLERGEQGAFGPTVERLARALGVEAAELVSE